MAVVVRAEWAKYGLKQDHEPSRSELPRFFLEAPKPAKVGVIMPALKTDTHESQHRAVRLVLELRKSSSQKQRRVARVANQLGVNRET